MIKEQQIKFYKLVGQRLTTERKRRNMTIAQLSTKSGEQNKTIRSIEAGSVCSLHHAVWMKSILGIDLNEILSIMEGKYHGEENSSGWDQLI